MLEEWDMLSSISWKYNQFNELYSPEISGSLFVNAPSDAVFERFLPKEFFQDSILGVVIGTDGGLILPFLQNKSEETKSIYICIEKKEIIDHIRASGYEDTENVKLYAEDFSLLQLMAIDEYDEFFFRRALLLLSSIAPIDNRLDYPEMLQKYRQQFNSLTLSQNLNAVTNVFIDAQLDNIADMVYPSRLLKNKFSGKTAVLLGGGPSVSRVFDWVKKNREYLVLFAANRISGRLQKEGISPDFFCAVDPQPALLDYSREIFSFSQESILLCAAPMAPNVASQWAGRIVYGDQLLPFFNEKNENICTGPTVMNYALQAAAYFGCNNILMAGVDLCFSKEGYSHESNSLEATLGKFLKHGGSQVKTYQGDMATTDTQMAVARDTMITQVKFINKVSPHIKLYQTNPDAAVIEGVDLVDVEQFALSENESIVEIMQDAKKMFDWDQKFQIEVLYKRVDVLEEKIKTYRNLRHSIKNTLVDVRRVTRLKDKSFNHAVDGINKTKEKIEKKLGDEIFELFDYAYLDYAKIISPLAKEGEMTLKEIQDILLNYFGATDNVLLKFGTQLSKSLLTLRLRIKEAEGVLDQEMLDTWLSRNEPGRGSVWRAHHPEITLSDEQVALLQSADVAFSELLANKVPSFKDHFTNKNYRLSSLWTQVQGAYQKEDFERLDVLVDFLCAEEQESDLKQIGYYATICSAFLRQDYEQVLLVSERIDHKNLFIPTLKLKLKVYTHLNQLEAMFDVLKQLVPKLPEYTIQLAVVAGLLGDVDLAVEAFQKAVLDTPMDEFVARQAWQWAQANQNAALLAWLTEYMQKIMPELLPKLAA